ncbi:MAG TPA: hypothetical protein VI935_01095 [Thermodesulfobacteriota bacterium]|nr:hypothetical protein [Thermodesulfobacteriota bacterium]
METQRLHLFACVQCGRVNEHACEVQGDNPNEVHYYHHEDSDKKPHSVEISRNAKGEKNYSLKACGKTMEEAKVIAYAFMLETDVIIGKGDQGGKK